MRRLYAKIKEAKAQVACTRHDSDRQISKVWDHLDKALQIVEDLIPAVEHDLETNGRDNPSCPMCRNYNAMLTTSKFIAPGVYESRCRDCGYLVIGKRTYKEPR